MIPLSRPSIGEEEIEAVARVLRSGQLAGSQELLRFEEEFASYIGTAHAVVVNSCASALQIAISAQEIKGEVIVPSFTFVASANAVLLAGCRPVFADIEEASGNLDPASVEACIGSQTAAIMPVHFAGQACRMDSIMVLAERHRLAVVEDSAQAIGAMWQGQRTGSFGTGCFSFFPTKNLTTGEGGMVTTNDARLAERIRLARGHGISKARKSADWPMPWHRVATSVGYNLRMTEFQAAMGRVQLARLDSMNESRRQCASFFSDRIAIEGIENLSIRPEAFSVHQMYALRLDTRRFDRNVFISALIERGVSASVHFDPPLHLQPLYAKECLQPVPLPATERLASRIVTIPIYPDLSTKQLTTIATAVHAAAEVAFR